MTVASNASCAAEMNFQSQYPGGISVTKIGEISFTPAASSIAAPVLSEGRGLVFCAGAFWLATTAAIVRAEAIMRIARTFFVFIILSGSFRFLFWMI